MVIFLSEKAPTVAPLTTSKPAKAPTVAPLTTSKPVKAPTAAPLTTSKPVGMSSYMIRYYQFFTSEGNRYDYRIDIGYAVLFRSFLCGLG